MDAIKQLKQLVINQYNTYLAMMAVGKYLPYDNILNKIVFIEINKSLDNKYAILDHLLLT